MAFVTSSEAAAPAFERPLSFCASLYDDDVKSMFEELPDLVDTCKRFGETKKGKDYAELCLPAFIIDSNKLEGTLSPGASEGETFKVLCNFLLSSERKWPMGHPPNSLGRRGLEPNQRGVV
jgi:hypothetical protein